MRRAPSVLVAALLGAALVVGAGEPKFPALSGPVVDAAGILSDATERALSAELTADQASNQRQVVVVTVASLDGLEIEDYGYRLGRHWGIGDAKRDDGALLIVAPHERKVRIEVGYGLEGELTDARCRIIIERAILPRFKQGDYDGGVRAGVAAIIGDAADEVAPVAEPNRHLPPGVIALLLLIFVIFIIIQIARAGGGYNGRGFGGGFGGGYGGGFGGGGFRGGGGFGGGGGGFGGGGASGGW